MKAVFTKATIALGFMVFAMFGWTPNASAQTPITIGPQSNTFTSMVRGYYFTSPVNFTICGLYIPTDASTGDQNVEIVRFTSAAPPAWPATTNAFTSLFYQNNYAVNAMIPCNVSVSNGDIMGIYGARGANMVNSYDGVNYVTQISGQNATLSRSGMQANLSTGQMANIWAETWYNIGRIIMYYNCCPAPPAPSGPFTGPMTVCQGDTVTYSIPWDPLAVEYEWTVPAGDSILSGQGDSLITVAIGPNSTGGQICVAMEDTCTTGPDTCFTYMIDMPATPVSISGPTTLCQNNSANYTTIPVSGASSYNWTVDNGATITSGQGGTNVNISFPNVGTTNVCVSAVDACAEGDSICFTVDVSPGPSPAVGGPDRIVCQGLQVGLLATNPTTGTGHWQIANAPLGNGGTFSDTLDNLSTYTTLQQGVHTLEWVVSTPGCPPNVDEVEVEVLVEPTADFSFEPGCEGAPIDFQDESDGNGTTIGSYYWDMNSDGIFDHYGTSFQHNFVGSGTFMVQLITTNLGCADTIVKPVQVWPKPYVGFDMDDDCQGAAIAFNNTTSLAGGTLDSLTWNFGDGTGPQITTAPNLNMYPNYLYDDPGDYNVSLRAVSDQGCVGTYSDSVRIFDNPEASFSVDNACQFQTTSFNDLSTVNDANIAVWAWDLDATTSNQQNPTYDYNVGGMVPVTLWVESSQGCQDDTTMQIEVFPSPTADFNFTNRVCEGEVTTLEQVATIAYGGFDSFDWLVIDDSVTASGPQFQYAFDSYGTAKVRLTVTSDEGCVDDITKDVPVYETPIADFKFNNACEDVAINFRDSSDFSGAIDRFTWKFDDGTSWVSEQYPTHTFDTFGTYDVTLIVESHKGCLDSITYPIDIYERVNPRFVAVEDSGCSPFMAELVDNTLNQTGTELTYTWTFMDGVSRVDTSYFTYVNESGKAKSYDVRLDILSDRGCFSTYTIEDYLTVLPQPLAYFETDQDLNTILTTNPVVQFMNKSQQENRVRWYFGDGTTSTLQNPSHQYDYEGQYEITLEAKNYLNCVDSFQMTANVVHENRPFIPSGFTPNGDGLNDFFYVEGLQEVTNVTMDVFDRWGNQIFHAVGKDARWDGKDMQSRIVQQGVYAYRVVYEDANGKEYEYQGNVTVLGVNR